MYNDEYSTCARTYATLLVYPTSTDPTAITERLRIEPSSWQRQGELILRAGRPPQVATISGWFLESKKRVESRDSRRHIDWLLDCIAPQAEVIGALQDEGCRIEISCYWLSQSGHGGPTMPPAQMKRLGELNIGLWFDFYGPYDKDND